MARLTYAEALDLLVLLRDHSGPSHPDEQMRFVHFCLARRAWSRGSPAGSPLPAGNGR